MGETGMETNYRVFVSYSHDDRQHVEKIVDVLRSNGLIPMWDEDFLYGSGFHDQIKNFIAHSHVFVPFITRESSQRGWVHQEIGYAMAQNIPILPITLDRIPGEMLQQLHAIPYSESTKELKNRLNRTVIERLVNRASSKTKPLYFCAALPDERTMMMVEYATIVLDLGYYGMVRQKGGLSSFHIPDKPISHIAYHTRYGNQYRESRCRMQKEERQILEKHAKAAGCRLIVDPYIDYSHYGPQAKAARLSELIEYLNTAIASNAKIEIVAVKPERSEDHLTIVGDWFAANAISASIGTGIRQTIFTRHAPSIQDLLKDFDEEFRQHLNDMGITAEDSVPATLVTLNRELEKAKLHTEEGSAKGN
jgi:hypothetical protein